MNRIALRRGLQAAGFDVAGYEPKPFTASEVSGVSRVVSFDQDIGARVGGRAVYAQWDHLPAMSDDYGRGRDAIIRRVDARRNLVLTGTVVSLESKIISSGKCPVRLLVALGANSKTHFMRALDALRHGSHYGARSAG